MYYKLGTHRYYLANFVPHAASGWSPTLILHGHCEGIQAAGKIILNLI